MRGDCSVKQEVNPTIDCIWYPLTTRLLNRDGSRINSTCWQIYNETGSFWKEHKQEWEEAGYVRGVYRAAGGHSSHCFLFVLLPWIQAVVLKPDFEAMAALLSGERFSRLGLLCGCQTPLLPLHMSHLINRPHVTRLLERSPLHYAGNTLPADGLEDTKPVFGVNVIFAVTRKSGSSDRGCSSVENNGVWPCVE